MRRRTVLTASATALVTAVAGCSSLGTDGDSSNGGSTAEEPLAVGDDSAGTRSTQTLRVTVDEELAGSEWQSTSATYPREAFTVQSAQHEDLSLGVDTNGDGSADETFGADAISGVNNNDFSFTVELDAGYALEQGDVLRLTYPAVENPSDSGEYEVELSVNERQVTTATVVVE